MTLLPFPKCERFFRREKDVKHAAIIYREFYDVPRVIVLTHRSRKLLLWCRFDKALDEYPAVYQVYDLPMEIDERAPTSWEDFPQKATKYLGQIPVDQLVFDTSKKAEIETDVIDSLL
jgi:hypothetical protein